MEDKELAIAAAEGDQNAFRTLVERYRRFIYAVAYRIVLNEDDALDATQEVFAKVATRLDQWRGQESLRGWLATIATREALNICRRPFRRERATDPQTLGQALDVGFGSALNRPASADPRVVAQAQQRKQMVLAAMEELSPQQRAMMQLRLSEEMKPTEIAKRMELAPAQVRSQLARAVARLRRILAGEEA